MGAMINGKKITGPTKEQYLDYLAYQRALRREVEEERVLTSRSEPDVEGP